MSDQAGSATLTLYNSPTQEETGTAGLGQDYLFNCYSACHGHAPGAEKPGDLTLSGWVRLDQYPDANHTAALALGGYPGWGPSFLVYGNTQDISFRIETASGVVTASMGHISIGRWTHVALTYDGEDVAAYLDGEQTGNNFHTRHSERPQIVLTDESHFDYLFHRLTAMIWLLLDPNH